MKNIKNNPTLHSALNVEKLSNQNKLFLGFTLVELIVVITILAILGTIGFLSIGGYSSRARDSSRVADISNITKSLDLSIITAGTYPIPDSAGAITYSWGTIWNQGTAGSNVMQYFRGTIGGGGIAKKPTDPLSNMEYFYSSLAFGNAYQLMASFEWDVATAAFNMSPLVQSAYADPGNPSIAYIRGNYGWLTAKTITWSTIYILAIPSIVSTATGAIELNSISGTLLFNGKSLNNASEFNPNSVPIIFSGSTLPTDDTTGKITAMITNLKTAYSSSDISGNSNIAGLLSATGTTAIVNLGTAIVTNQLGGKAVAVSESGKINVCKTSSVIDADNNPYNTVSIGTQCWMKTNLRTTKNPDGTSITKGNAGHGSGGWDDSTTKYYGCPPNVNNTMEDCDVAATYGLLYQWPAAMNGSTVPGAQGICPDGWHVPTDAEFTILVESQANIAGCDAGSSWQCPNAGSKLGGGEADWFTFTGGIKLDSSGVVRPEFGKSDFNALPTGYRFFNSNYTDRTKYATFWSSTPIESSNSVRARRFSSNLPTVWRASLARPFGYSLRCIQN